MGALITLLITAVHFLINKGILYCIISLISYVYLKFTLWFNGHRFKLYDVFINDDPEKMSFFVPQEEYKWDKPHNALHLKKNRDSVLFMGVNSNCESLAVQITRKPMSQVHCSLVLRLSNGRTYTLPEDHSIQPEVDDPLTFGTSRLKLQCLSPMRRWRVFFNGILKETSDGQDSQAKYLHVRFAFLWVSSSGVFDYYNDMSTAVLTDVAATEASWKWSPILILQRLRSIFNNYEQCGMMLGTVTLPGEPEKEVYLWGCRGHYMGKNSAMKEADFEDIFVNAQNGTFVHLGKLNSPGTIRNFTYGFVMRPNGYIYPIEKCHELEEDIMGNVKKYRCFAGGEEYTIQTEKENASYDGLSSIIHCNARLNVMKARSLIYKCKIQPQPELAVKKPKVLFTSKNSVLSSDTPPLSLSFEDPCCQLLDLTGGKGSSLAKLFVIRNELKNFTVPKGIVVTTAAYRSFVQGNLNRSLQKFEKAIWSMTAGTTKAECQSLVEELVTAKLPENVKESVENNLKDIFGSEFENLKFAVRSSATGEDTEQMSAAGQMETFLGCKGLTEIFQALKKCWASQFSHTAIEYKRQYGQPLNTPMAVVIQQMVPCDAAGVIFTCDPVTGNPSYISITANYGLGESVVSASADPDTVTLERDENDAISIHSQSPGKKKSKIIMDDFGGTREIHVEEAESNEYCISRETAFCLGEIAVKIEEIFGAPRDIEWGVLDGEIYLFQSRPVTSLDIETDFEIKHSFDSHMRREDEYSTTANIGEIFPGATSPAGLFLVRRNFEVAMARQKYVKWDGEALPETPYMAKRLVCTMCHPFLCILDAYFRFSENEGDEINDHTKATTIAIFGRVIEDKKIFDIARDRHKGSEERGMSRLGKIYILIVMFFSNYFVKKASRLVKNFQIPVKENSSSEDILRNIGLAFHNMNDVMNVHFDTSFSSALWNNSVLTILSNAKGAWDNDVFSDFAYLLSTCSHVVESADVPSSIQKLGFTISHIIQPEEFKKMTTEEALEWLKISSSEAGTQFRDFMKRHGHRCLKEFDMYSLTWEMNAKPLVKILQGIVGTHTKDTEEKGSMSFEKIMSHLNVHLGFLDKLKLRLLLPNSQRGVREREFSKSTLVQMFDKFRVAYWKLADTMVKEGRLPNRDLLFFLDTDEMIQLIKTRSPRLVAKAFRRWKFHPELDRIIFPEIMSGIPRPINMNEEVIASENGFTITGVPVSQGVTKGTGRVILNLDDANQIQRGDILITYGTDIGWSPYFALLSGVATEIGGLISHGAVVAREYGLPCVVNLYGASRAFKSGDRVLLDGNRGLLQKIE